LPLQRFGERHGGRLITGDVKTRLDGGEGDGQMELIGATSSAPYGLARSTVSIVRQSL